MKHLIALFFIFSSAIMCAQNTGLIVGKVLDKELDNTPLAFANVSIKGTNLNVTSDISGAFLFENLESGKYTLICNFAGYETKEIQIEVNEQFPAEVKLSLGAFTLPPIETAANNG